MLKLEMSSSQVTLPTSSILEEVVKLEAVQNMEVIFDYAMKYGTVVGAATMIGGILAGPVGLAAGGILSSWATGLLGQGKFTSVVHILLYETSQHGKELLAQLIREQLYAKNIYRMCDFIRKIVSCTEFQALIVQIVIGFVANYLHGKITQ